VFNVRSYVYIVNHVKMSVHTITCTHTHTHTREPTLEARTQVRMYTHHRGDLKLMTRFLTNVYKIDAISYYCHHRTVIDVNTNTYYSSIIIILLCTWTIIYNNIGAVHTRNIYITNMCLFFCVCVCIYIYIFVFVCVHII